jgi:hypothetical protein
MTDAAEICEATEWLVWEITDQLETLLRVTGVTQILSSHIVSSGHAYLTKFSMGTPAHKKTYYYKRNCFKTITILALTVVSAYSCELLFSTTKYIESDPSNRLRGDNRVHCIAVKESDDKRPYVPSQRWYHLPDYTVSRPRIPQYGSSPPRKSHILQK